MQGPFVSISAVSSLDELSKVIGIAKEVGVSRPLVIGYQVSNKSINQGTKNPRQPYFSQLGELDRATRDHGLVTAVHYYTKDNETVIGDLEKVAESGVDPTQTLVQFNTLPLTPDVLLDVRNMGYGLIFKVAVADKQSGQGGYAVWKGEGVQDAQKGEVLPLVTQVLQRSGVIDYVMFDPSHGTNLRLGLEEDSLALRFGREITQGNPTRRGILSRIGLVYAGGINPNNVGAITQTLRSSFHNRFSIDVESGVRTDDRLDFDKVRAYLNNFEAAMN